MEPLLLGIDFGTGGCKVTAIAPDGALAGEASVEYATRHDHPGWSEQDPADWWEALRGALAKLAEKGVDLSRVAALSLDGSTHNAVLLGADWKPVRRTIMWTDQRSTAECEALRRSGAAERVFERCYQMPAPTWTLPQLMWLKAHEPDVLARTEHVLFVKDYVRHLLTGEAATDRIEAQGTLFFDMKRQDWDEEFVRMAGLRPAQLPRLLEPTALAGRVTPEAAAATGLPAGTPVACGTSDSAVEDYGAGAVEPGDLILKLATAGNVNAMTAEPHPHPKTLTYGHVVPGMWYSVSATNAAALCMRWLRDTFFEVKSAASPPVSGASPLSGPSAPSPLSREAALSPAGALSRKAALSPAGALSREAALSPAGALSREAALSPAGALSRKAAFNVYARIDAEAATSPVGANGVMFHPYLQGERCPYWDANLRASFTGVSIASTRGDFCRALMEGVAFSLRDCFRTLEEMELPARRVFLIGGGARSIFWGEIVADVFNRAVAIPEPGDASFGAALLAGVAAGFFRDAREAVARCLRIGHTVEPEPAAVAQYAELFARYRAVHDALAPVYQGTRT